jgi:hypothetical protein
MNQSSITARQSDKVDGDTGRNTGPETPDLEETATGVLRTRGVRDGGGRAEDVRRIFAPHARPWVPRA